MAKSNAKKAGREAAAQAIASRPEPPGGSGEPAAKGSWSDLARQVRQSGSALARPDTTSVNPLSDDDRSAATRARDQLKETTGIDADQALGSVAGGAAATAAVASGVGAAAAGLAASGASALATKASGAVHAAGARLNRARKTLTVAGVLVALTAVTSIVGAGDTSQQAAQRDAEVATMLAQEAAQALSASATCETEQVFPYGPALGGPMAAQASAVAEEAVTQGLSTRAAVIATTILLHDGASGFDASATLALVTAVPQWQALDIDTVASTATGAFAPGSFAPLEAAARAAMTAAGLPAGEGCIRVGQPLICSPSPTAEQAFVDATPDALALVRCLWELMAVDPATTRISGSGTVITFAASPASADLAGMLGGDVSVTQARTGAAVSEIAPWLRATALTFGIHTVRVGDEMASFLTRAEAQDAEDAAETYVVVPASPAGASGEIRVTVFGNAGTGLMPSSGQWAVPTAASCMSSEFNPRRVHPILKVVRPHNGIDFAAGAGTPILAANDGTVTFSRYSSGGGNMVVIDHGSGVYTWYLHLLSSLVDEDQQVTSGQVIGYVGSTGRSTGPHLHLEVHRGGAAIDPRPFFESVGAPLPPRC